MTCQMHKAKLQNPIIHKPDSFPKKQYHNLTIKKEKIGRKKGLGQLSLARAAGTAHAPPTAQPRGSTGFAYTYCTHTSTYAYT